MIDGGLRSLFGEHIPGVHWQAIETGGTGRGIPDLNGCYLGREVWIECKLTIGWAVPLQPWQAAWLMRRARAGGHPFLAVRRCCRETAHKTAYDELHLIEGANAHLALSGGLRTCPKLLTTSGGPARWDWAEVARLLFTPT